ncbi:NAD-dependent epimerase/dehydratase family protein [Novosphingobium decolorationis]|uniref:NAD(P)-dependent oxidoreductase n=1 Tax=Novosphingobium decolorationis TaxID=2698673 RepID=A0ABX8E2K1_9SPHN|nr:NAD(P)-dependent oxidoreductase [Novosphingobium decolorationis]QVM83143.1 NAD(P)-dependent oxidoreductase [Novosphingobium decolorationis]
MLPSVSFVTGAAGFVGAHLVRSLLERGAQVHALVRPSTRLERLAPVLDRITLHRIDLSDRTALEACLKEVSPTHVYHLAADTRPRAASPIEAVDSAIHSSLTTTLPLVEALAGLPVPPRIVVRAGTLAEYGPTDVPSREDGPVRPATPYGAGMLALTAALDVLAASLPFPVVTARLALCYGPSQSRAFLLAEAIDAFLDERPITLSAPDDRRDLMHVEDAVAGLMRIADIVPANCPVINIGSGHAPRMADVLETLRALIGAPADFVRLDSGASRRPVTELRTCPELAWHRLGWRCAIGLEEGLVQTIASERRARAARLAQNHLAQNHLAKAHLAETWS